MLPGRHPANVGNKVKKHNQGQDTVLMWNVRKCQATNNKAKYQHSGKLDGIQNGNFRSDIRTEKEMAAKDKIKYVLLYWQLLDRGLLVKGKPLNYSVHSRSSICTHVTKDGRRLKTDQRICQKPVKTEIN